MRLKIPAAAEARALGSTTDDDDDDDASFVSVIVGSAGFAGHNGDVRVVHLATEAASDSLDPCSRFVLYKHVVQLLKEFKILYKKLYLLFASQHCQQ
jgi:hypothetical protein